ncbi:MAG: hypothetical protein L3J41_17665 [Melioribacteraceae bacterium]|nr:hypothetical protein [Melioribacteraceae bacterium]
MNKLKSLINTPNILLLVITIFAIFAQTLPLLQVLNFEFSFVFSILLFIASGILTIFYLRKFKSFGLLPAIIRMKYKSYLLLLFTPLLVSILSNLLFQICPICDGILYYLVIVIPAFYFGFITGAFTFWISKKFSYLIFSAIFILFAFAPILEFYIYPQVYFFNIIVGIIPGTIYDEEILLSGKLIFFRLLHFILFTTLLYSMFKVGTIKRKNRKLLLLSTIMGAFLFFLLKPYLGFTTTKYELLQTLKMGVLTSGVEIRYADNLTFNNANLLAREAIYYMSEIERKTKLSTPHNLIAYIFKDANQKGALFGSKAANVAKPWMNQIFFDYNSVENTLEHELVHSYTAQIGSTPFKIADGFNMAMLEGYAMAIEDNYSGYDIHYMALLAKESGYNFNIAELFLRFNFFSQASSLSYITAGSFIKYLIEVYGIEKVNSIYEDLDFEKYLGNSLTRLSTKYVQYLDYLNYPINKHRANLFFGRNPITKKVCARTVSKEINAAWKFYREESYYSSLNSFKTIFEYSNSYKALLGIIYSNSKFGLYSESLKLLEGKMDEYEGTSSYYSALLNFGDQLSYNQNFEKADSIYRILSKFEPTARYKNLAEIRIKLITERKILLYLNESDFDKYGILKSLNKDELFDASIPIMIELSERLNENISTFSSFIDGKASENISSNSAYEISKYLFKNFEYKKSLRYADLSIKKCSENYRMPILKSHRKKIEWFSN